jgi:hypothetical protein
VCAAGARPIKQSTVCGARPIKLPTAGMPVYGPGSAGCTARCFGTADLVNASCVDPLEGAKNKRLCVCVCVCVCVCEPFFGNWVRFENWSVYQDRLRTKTGTAGKRAAFSVPGVDVTEEYCAAGFVSTG